MIFDFAEYFSIFFDFLFIFIFLISLLIYELILHLHDRPYKVNKNTYFTIDFADFAARKG